MAGRYPVDELFSRYLSLDPDELAAASDAAFNRLAEIESRRSSPRRPAALASDGELAVADDENGAASWADAVEASRSAGDRDFGARALRAALEGDAGEYSRIKRDASLLPLEQLHARIAEVGVFLSHLGSAGVPAFKAGASEELRSLVFSAYSAVESVHVMLRSERARRLHLAKDGGGRQTKSARGRDRRMKAMAKEEERAEKAFAAAAASCSASSWLSDGGTAPSRQDSPGGRRAASDQSRRPAPSDPPRETERPPAVGNAKAGLGGARPERGGVPEAPGAGRSGADAAGGAPRDGFVRVAFPAEAVFPYASKPDSNGRVWDKAVVRLPEGAASAGTPLSGYRLDRFLQGFHKQAVAEGRDVVFRFREGEAVRLFASGRRDVELDPRELGAAVAEARAAEGGGEAPSASEGKGRGYVTVPFPASAVSPTRGNPDRAQARIPDGTALAGRPLDGYSAYVGLKGFHKEALAQGRTVSFAFPDSRPVRLYSKGRPAVDVDPRALRAALRAASGADVPARGPAAKTPGKAIRNAARLGKSTDDRAALPAPSR